MVGEGEIQTYSFKGLCHFSNIHCQQWKLPWEQSQTQCAKTLVMKILATGFSAGRDCSPTPQHGNSGCVTLRIHLHLAVGLIAMSSELWLFQMRPSPHFWLFVSSPLVNRATVNSSLRPRVLPLPVSQALGFPLEWKFVRFKHEDRALTLWVQYPDTQLQAEQRWNCEYHIYIYTYIYLYIYLSLYLDN